MGNKTYPKLLKTEAEQMKPVEEFNFSNQLLLNNGSYTQIMPCRPKCWVRIVRFFFIWFFILQIHMLAKKKVYQKTCLDGFTKDLWLLVVVLYFRS